MTNGIQAKDVAGERRTDQAPLVDLFLRFLKAEGIRVVFGIPGGLLHPFFAAVEADPDISLIVTKHECGAAFMADGYARLGGGLAVAAATSGPGATNLITGVSVAHSDGVPMLVVTGQAPSHSMGKGAAQETTREDVDVVSMFRPITKYSAMVMPPESLPHHFRRAMRLARSGRPGPVHLNIPVDYWSKTASDSWVNPMTYRFQPNLFDREEVRHAAKALLKAERPVILAGSGANAPAARAELIRIAEVLQARVVTTPRAKGVFPEDHPLSLGVFGFAGHNEARNVLLGDGIDLLFAVGASMNETTTFNWNPRLGQGRTLVQLDIDIDRIGRNYPVDVPLVGDSSTILLELWHHIQRELEAGTSANSNWASAPPLARYPLCYINPERRTSTKVPLQPERWRVELSDVLPDDAVVFSDIGGHMLFNLQHLHIRRGQRFILNLNFGSMGHGVAAPIGAALANPDRPIIAIVGDGGFSMTGMELLTAVEYNIPVIWIVENNQMHGITWHGSKLVSGGRAMESIVYKHKLEVSGMAQAMGLQVWRVERPGELGAVLKEALARRRPALLDVIVDPMVSPPLGDRAKTVAGFKS